MIIWTVALLAKLRSGKLSLPVPPPRYPRDPARPNAGGAAEGVAA